MLQLRIHLFTVTDVYLDTFLTVNAAIKDTSIYSN